MSTDLPRAKGQLAIPLSRQENSYSCGAAVIRSVFLKLGIEVEEKLLRDVLKTTPEDGTDPRVMISFLREIPGLRVDAGPMTVDDLRRAVTFEVMVIIDLQAWSDEEDVDYQNTWDDGHYVVLSGFDRDTLFFADPSSDVTATLPMGGLQERWHDEDIDGDRWGNLGISVSVDSVLQDSSDWKALVEAKLKRMSEKTASQSRVARTFAMKLALATKKWGPFQFEIDRPKGFKKEWPQDDGSVKKYTYETDYGYFVGHTGEDDEGLDAFVGDDPEGAIESFLKLKPSEDGETLVPDETKFLVGLSDAERKKVLGLYKPEEIVGLREYEDVYELIAVLNAFRDRKKAAARLASRFLQASQKSVERDRKATHIVVRDVHGVREYLNNTNPPGGWSKKDYLAIPFELTGAEEMAVKFEGEVVPRKRP